MLRRFAFLGLVIMTCTLGGAGCASRQEPAAPQSAPPDISTLVIANNWDAVNILSGYATTDVSNTGHFLISRNACFVEESGAITLDQWTALAKSVNAAGKLTLMTDPICFPGLTSTRALDGNVGVKFASGVKMLMEARGTDVCSWIPDEQVSKDLLTAVNSILVSAFSENCSL